ncbi:MAG: PqqD family protein [Cytophagales bacterium]|nr:PqqD family protein [Armatimonadota bacterium]
MHLFGSIKNMVNGNRPKVTRAQMLGAIPVRNVAVQWGRETRDEARPRIALLRIPRRSDRFGNTIAKLFRLPEFRKLELDEIGSDVWEMCDGTISVEAVTRAICAKYHLNRRQAEASVAAYLKMLAERRLIALRSPKATAAKNPSSGGTTSRRRKQV